MPRLLIPPATPLKETTSWHMTQGKQRSRGSEGLEDKEGSFTAQQTSRPLGGTEASEAGKRGGGEAGRRLNPSDAS